MRGSVHRYSNPGFIDYDYLLRTPGVSEPEPDPTDPAAVEANLRREPDANTEDTLSARFSLLWEPTPDLSALVAYHLQDQRVGARQVNHARSFDTGRYVSAHRYLEPNDRKNELLSLELTWGLRGAELTSAAGYSTGEGPWRWVGGVFFNRYDSRGTSFEYAPGLTEFSGVTPILGGIPVSEPVEYYSLGAQAVDERALFGEVSRDFGDRWRVTAGGRWFGYGVATGNLTEFPYTPMYNSPYSDHESDDSGVLFKGSVSYRLDATRRTCISRGPRGTASAAATTSGCARTRSSRCSRTRIPATTPRSRAASTPTRR